MKPRTELERQNEFLRALGALSHRSGELKMYLREIVHALADLIHTDWVAITLCRDGIERVMASNLADDPDDAPKAVHGEVTDTVARTGSVVVVEDVLSDPSRGTVPHGYRAYLGVPLRTARGEVLGTV